uniref:Mitotic spindle assembly checkpoint protein MAD1 n=1 Tax=Globodera rostochiensis TaxID=31243 RepID=A0A914IAF7_GLORO
MSFEDDQPEVSRIFEQKVERRFQRDFGRFMHHTANDGIGHERHQQRRQSRQQQHGADQQTVKLIEANETIALLRRQLEVRDEELERMRRAEAAANERVSDAQREAVRWQAEAQRVQRRASSGARSALSEHSGGRPADKLILDDYRRALSKYYTWSTFALKQLQTMKLLLEECGGWTETNRYKIYFSYRDIKHEEIAHEKVADLASGSIIGAYFGAIEEVENISATVTRPKFQSAQTQTNNNNNSEANSSSAQLQPFSPLNSAFSMVAEEEEEDEGSNNRSSDAVRVVNGGGGRTPAAMTAQELRLIDCERDIERLEIECSKQHEQIIILGERAKRVELLEEQKADLQMQTDILRRQNEQLIRDHEELKCVFGGGSISRNGLEELVRSAGQLRQKNKELETKLQQLELQQRPEAPTVGESRRIAQLLKLKYEAELGELRTKLQKYEPLHASNTTRILRFATANPLDEARDELVIREVAAAAVAAASAANPLKRRKMDNSDSDAGMGDGISRKRFDRDDDDGPLKTGEGDEFTEDEDNDQQQLTEAELEEDSGHVHNLRVQLRALKHRLRQTEKGSAEVLREFRETVALLSGYDVRIGEEGFCEVENVHSKNCVFLFQKHDQQPPTVDLLDNECAQRWKDMIANYLAQYNSVPAFLSAVTISLVETPEEFVSSSQQSQQSVSSDTQHQF